MVRQIAMTAVVAAAIAAAPAAAQQRPVSVTASVVAVGPLSGSGRQFTTGLGVDLGVTWHIGDQIGLKFDYVQSKLSAKHVPEYPASVATEVKPRLQFGTANFLFQAPPGRFRIYVTGGVGIYRRVVSLAVSGPGPVSICNPWWFVCYPGPVIASRANGSHATTDIGVNVGAGFAVGKVFAEMRYHYVWGPAFETASGRVPATGKFLPITVGVRF